MEVFFFLWNVWVSLGRVGFVSSLSFEQNLIEKVLNLNGKSLDMSNWLMYGVYTKLFSDKS